MSPLTQGLNYRSACDGDDQIRSFVGFIDPNNLGIDTKISSLARFIEEL